MSIELSKLHVRFIQTQKQFSLQSTPDQKAVKLPLGQLYVKDKSHFYLINFEDTIQEDQPVTIFFSEPDVALKSLTCELDAKIVDPTSSNYEDALLFFPNDTKKVKQLVLLTIEKLS